MIERKEKLHKVEKRECELREEKQRLDRNQQAAADLAVKSRDRELFGGRDQVPGRETIKSQFNGMMDKVLYDLV